MAKKTTKKASKAGINMALEIREILKQDPQASNNSVLEQLRAKFPGVTFNEDSVGVGCSTQRRKLDIVLEGRTRKPGKKTARKKKVAKKTARGTAARKAPAARSAAGTTNEDFDRLQKARHYVAEFGGTIDEAIDALRKLEKLQV
jgi:hypothetical protein